MHRYVAFLRGMNLGGRRITNEALCGHFQELGFEDVWAFLASGNVVFHSASTSRTRVAKSIETGLGDALGYAVPTVLRTAEEVTAIGAENPFGKPHGANGGNPQVALLGTPPTKDQRKAVLSLSTADDQLAFRGQELFWLPDGKLLDSTLDFRSITQTLGMTTVRTQRTLQRLAQKFL